MTAAPPPLPDDARPATAPDESGRDAAAGPVDRPRFGAARAIVAVLLGLLVAWFLWDGLSSLVGLPAQYEALGIADRTPWVVLVAGVVAPPLIFGLGILVARRQSVTRFTLVLIVALATIATTRLSLIATAASLSGF